MGDTTKIEWADATVNWWWGCTKISPGCANCYAETLAARFGVEWGPNVPRKVIKGAPAALERLARQGDKTGIAPRVFMQSMSDLFEDREDLIEPRKVLWDLLHKFATRRRRIIPMILTKRPALMAEWAKEHGWPENAWVGTTAENQKAVDERIPYLLSIPARVRFLSCEPLLGLVVIPPELLRPIEGTSQHGQRFIDWVIVGGESGPKARPMHPAWARSLRDQCVAAGVKYHFKQWGEWERQPPSATPGLWVLPDGTTARHWIGDPGPRAYMVKVGKHAAGRILDGRTWDEVPE